jgi:flagellar motility protein MotE (MotC chaperone)
MHRLGTLALASAAVKVIVLGVLWWQGAARAAGGRSEAPPPAAAPAPPPSGRGLREMLAAVAQRNAELDAREKALAEREAALAALEKTIAAAAAAAAPGGAVAQPASGGPPGPAAETPVVALTKVYETMKPEEAGAILDRLDDTTARMILAHMKERSIGAILAAMSRDRAVEVTRVLGGEPAKSPEPAGPAATDAQPKPPAAPPPPAAPKPPAAPPSGPTTPPR